MLHAHILVSELLRFRLSAQKNLVQVPAHVYTGISSLYLIDAGERRLCPLYKILRLDPHLLDKLQDQAVINGQKTVKQVLLLDLLVSVFIGKLFALVHSFNGLLCKFLNVH